MTRDEIRNLAKQAVTSIDAGLICLLAMGKDHKIPDAELQSVAAFFADAGRDVVLIRDDQTP